MNTHDIDIELPKPFMTVYDDVDKVEVGCYSEIQVRAAIEADRKRIADTLDALSRDANGMYEQEMDAHLLGLSDGYDYAAQVVLGNTRDGEADLQRGGEPVAWSANTNVNPRPTYQWPPPPPPPPPFQPMEREYVERFGGLVRKDSAGPDSGPEIGMAEAAIKKATGGKP